MARTICQHEQICSALVEQGRGLIPDGAGILGSHEGAEGRKTGQQGNGSSQGFFSLLLNSLKGLNRREQILVNGFADSFLHCVANNGQSSPGEPGGNRKQGEQDSCSSGRLSVGTSACRCRR